VQYGALDFLLKFNLNFAHFNSCYYHTTYIPFFFYGTLLSILQMTDTLGIHNIDKKIYLNLHVIKI